MTEKRSLTHNECYSIKGASRRANYESMIKKKEYIEAIFLRYKKGLYNERTIIQAS